MDSSFHLPSILHRMFSQIIYEVPEIIIYLSRFGALLREYNIIIENLSIILFSVGLLVKCMPIRTSLMIINCHYPHG